MTLENTLFKWYTAISLRTFNNKGWLSPPSWKHLHRHLQLPVNLPDAVVVPHHVDALRVRQVAVVDEEAEDAPAAEVELLPDDALEVGHHAARVQVHEQPAHPAVHHGRRRVVEVEPQADKVAAVGSHDDKRACVRERHNKHAGRSSSSFRRQQHGRFRSGISEQESGSPS